MREKRNSHKILTGKYGEKILLGRILTMWENNKTDPKGNIFEGINGIEIVT
jgi:hypothetical protein